MKIYIAGKITGNPNYQQEFKQAEQQERAKGHIVLSPAILPEGMSQADYMRICLAMLDTADAAYFLPRFEESAGAMLEWAWCEKTGKPHSRRVTTT